VSLAGGLRTRSGHAATHEQIQIVESAERLVAAGVGGALKIIAFAGAGKTSTLDLLASTALKGMAGTYLAFNSSIADDAKKTMPKNVAPSTIHSLAIRTTGMRPNEKYKNIKIDIVKHLLGDRCWLPPREAGDATLRTQQHWIVEGLKQFCQSADIEPGINQINYVLHQIGTPKHGMPVEILERLIARRTAAESLLTQHLAACWKLIRSDESYYSFDAIIKMFELSDKAVAAAFSNSQFVFLDEAQDLNPVLRSIGLKATSNNNKILVAVGDPWQQIYTWNGAENALDHIDGNVLYLSQSFRFGEKLADRASNLLFSKPGATPETEIKGNPARKTYIRSVLDTDFKYERGQVVICRTNRGLFTSAVAIAKSGLKIAIVKGIQELIDEVNSATALFEERNKDAFISPWSSFIDWAEAKASVADEDMSGMKQFMRDIENGNLAKEIDIIKRAIVADESKADIILTTAHKSKGREFRTVVLCSDFPTSEMLQYRYDKACRSTTNRDDEIRSALEEWNVRYVAMTRAIEMLINCYKEDKRQKFQL
jgi:hypothetical protein